MADARSAPHCLRLLWPTSPTRPHRVHRLRVRLENGDDVELVLVVAAGNVGLVQEHVVGLDFVVDVARRAYRAMLIDDDAALPHDPHHLARLDSVLAVLARRLFGHFGSLDSYRFLRLLLVFVLVTVLGFRRRCARSLLARLDRRRGRGRLRVIEFRDRIVRRVGV